MVLADDRAVGSDRSSMATGQVAAPEQPLLKQNLNPELCSLLHAQSCPGEESNMLLVPRWLENGDDQCIPRIVDALLLMLGPLGPNEDVRYHMHHLRAAVASTHTPRAALAM